MILIAIEQTGEHLILHACDLYSGSHTHIAAVTTDEMILRFHPLLASWLSFSKAKEERFKRTVGPPAVNP